MNDFNRETFVQKSQASGWKVENSKSVHISVPKQSWSHTLQESRRATNDSKSSNSSEAGPKKA